MKIEFSKYKRVFAFGCSFTNYIYPTWADIIANEMPDAQFYNFAKNGGGNLLITSRLAEANHRFKFSETDLVMVMYTTSFREDRYINGSWVSKGNIYNQDFYPMRTFVAPFCQPTGMIIRDLAMIETSSQYIKSLPSDSLLLKAAPMDSELSWAMDSHILNIYKDLINSFPITLYESEFPNGWGKGIPINENDGSIHYDSHPVTKDYYNYLLNLGINLTDRSKKYVEEASTKLNRCKYRGIDFPREFPELDAWKNLSGKVMF
jgi:hypothetical protein